MSLNLFFLQLILLPRWMKKGIVLLLDCIFCFVATWATFSLLSDQPAPVTPNILFAGSVSAILIVPIFTRLGLYRAIFSFTGWYATLSLIRAMTIYMVVYLTAIMFFGASSMPRSVGILQPIILFICIGLMRLLSKHLLNISAPIMGDKSYQKVALIYGAGSAGRQIASGLRQGSGMKAIAFIDENPRYWGGFINGLPVYSPDKIAELVESKSRVTDILLAIPSASRFRQREILKALSDLPVHVRTLPGLSALANGIVKVEDIQNVQIEHVLGREPVEADASLLCQNIEQKVVIVTGAGGSIGSELCRQISALNPRMLILFELNEFALFRIERELLSLNRPVEIVAILGSVLDKTRFGRILEQFNVQTVFHAAAYKHVPLIEQNPVAGVCNNVFGTLYVAEASCEAEVELFVLISTDKAVRPTNIMGCSKRLSELVLQAIHVKNKDSGVLKSKFTMVRFGNVLGSSGSVVPLFSEQIRDGGPVTVTHPDIVRYFMTIPEAAQLVIQAGAICKGGDVMVLDMGEPVKIFELAKRMIHLSGFSHKDDNNPNGDIEIRFTGLRSGEKLYEELLIGDKAFSTSHPRILRAEENVLGWNELRLILAQLEAALSSDDLGELRRILKLAVPEFRPELGG